MDNREAGKPASQVASIDCDSLFCHPGMVIMHKPRLCQQDKAKRKKTEKLRAYSLIPDLNIPDIQLRSPACCMRGSTHIPPGDLEVVSSSIHY